MTPEIQAQLDQLRDIHLPDPVGWWPLAPGWWAVLALFCAVALGAGLWHVLRIRGLRYIALHELEALDERDADRFATELSVLLRRVALRQGRAVGPLKDADWTAFLSDTGFDPEFAEHLAVAPYAKTFAAPDARHLRQAAAQWIRSQT